MGQHGPEAKTRQPERTVQIDNGKALVVLWRFPPGACVEWHRHEFDYVVVPLTSGSLTVSNRAGSAEARLVAGQPYARYAGVEHRVENRTEEEILWVEIDLKTRKLP
jgi:quercetin dioxygenase-like cupin family protein